MYSLILTREIFMRYSSILSVLTLAGLTAMTATIVMAPSRLSAQTPISSVGWEVEGSQQLNKIPIYEMVYTGECPGLSQEIKPARFISSKTPPNEHQRVVIRNITPGMEGDRSPYTNREYHRGRTSEATQMELGTKHSSKRFRVTGGENQFEYEIRQRQQVIDSGRFTAVIDRITQKRDRSASWYEDQVCANSAVDAKVCADLRDRRQYRCEDGKVLKTEMDRNNDNDRVLTTISNQTDRHILTKIEGDSYRIEPGETIRLRRRSYGGEHLSVNFNTGANTTKNTNVTIGKRLKFQTRHSGSTDIELVDYPRN
jgi:hypothetical protein